MFFFFSSRRRHTRLTCDWSSDVCSSDLEPLESAARTAYLNAEAAERQPERPAAPSTRDLMPLPDDADPLDVPSYQIGRASCRERVEISEGAVALKQKTTCNSRPWTHRNA